MRVWQIYSWNNLLIRVFWLHPLDLPSLFVQRSVLRLFDVCWAWQQGIGYTPQTGNEKFKQIDQQVTGLWREKNPKNGQQECRQIERGRLRRMCNRRNESRGLKVAGEKVVSKRHVSLNRAMRDTPKYVINRLRPPMLLLSVGFYRWTIRLDPLGMTWRFHPLNPFLRGFWVALETDSCCMHWTVSPWGHAGAVAVLCITLTFDTCSECARRQASRRMSS